MELKSKLPAVGTTIFSRMSQLAQQHGALNLSQGFPDFPAEPRLLDALNRQVLAGRNQYAPMPGVPELRQQISLIDQQKHSFVSKLFLNISLQIPTSKQQRIPRVHDLYNQVTALNHSPELSPHVQVLLKRSNR